MDRSELQAFVRKHRKTNVSFLERKLWDIAESAPLGGGLPGGSELDPYLLRVYVSPRDPQFKWLWTKMQRFTRDIGQYKPALFQGVPHLYLHHFFRGDADSEVHNHPWRFSLSLILTGGYIEQRWDPWSNRIETRRCNPGAFNVIRRDDFHRVTLNAPDRGCWTLFLTSNRVEEKSGYDWGFLNTQTQAFTPWGPFTARQQGEVNRSA